MKLNKNSTSAKLYRWFYKTDTMPTNLCPYFWKLVTAVILSPFLAILTLPYEIVYSNIKYKSYKLYDDMIVRSLALWLVIYCIVCMVSSLGLVFFSVSDGLLLKKMMIIGLFLWIMVIVVGVGYGIIKIIKYTNKKIVRFIKNKMGHTQQINYIDINKIVTEKTDSIIIEMVKAKFHKYCPKIDWK
jgi:hypothetical protein